MNSQTIQVETRQRSFSGKLVKWLFIAFNILMLIWLVVGLGSVGQGIDEMSQAQKAGTAIGAGIGAMFIFGLWVLGDIILGIAVLLTRGKKIITTQTGIT